MDPYAAPHLWVLDGRTPVPAPDILSWGQLLEDVAGRRVGLWRWYDPATERSVSVSTMFLGQSVEALLTGKPRRLFETLEQMQDGPDVEEYERTWTWDTWEQAAAGHAEIVAVYRRVLMLPDAELGGGDGSV